MEQGNYFDFSCSPTISYPALRIVIATTAYFFYYCAILNVTNCFQNNAIEACKRVFVQAPVCYIEWFKERYPNIKLP
jgi:hypothetical protein